LEASVDAALERINGKLFTADDVGVATGLRGQSLTNTLTRSPLTLASKSPGRGRARLFPLIDIYQLAITGTLTRCSGDMQWSAYAANYVLFGIGGDLLLRPEDDLEDLGKLIAAFGGNETPENVAAMRQASIKHLAEMAADISKCHDNYSNRDINNPDYLVAEMTIDGIMPFYNSPFRSPNITKNPVNFGYGGIRVAGIVVNMTELFRNIDLILAKRFEQRNK
jgi:hypothetical protein